MRARGRAARSGLCAVVVALAVAPVAAGAEVGPGDQDAHRGADHRDTAPAAVDAVDVPDPADVATTDASGPVAAAVGVLGRADERPAITRSSAPGAPPPPIADEPEPDPDVAGASDRFLAAFGDHEAAEQVEGEPDTFHWAVLIGVDAYQGRTGNTLGSVADVGVMEAELAERGWRDDHVLVLTDDLADRHMITEAMSWLARKTDDRSTVVLSYSGHLRHRDGTTALWPADNAFIWADELGERLGAIRGHQLWFSLQGCHAAGLAAPGVEGDGRIVTYSSQTPQKSYEDPEVGMSVQGFFLFAEAFRDGWGDVHGDEDGVTSVQEAYDWAAPRIGVRTNGYQTPVLVDGLGRSFHLEIDDAAHLR